MNQGKPLNAPYREVDKTLGELLVQFGPPRKTYHTEYPFWRLQNDGIWELIGGERLVLREGQTDAKKSELLKYDIPGGFKKKIANTLLKDPRLIREIAGEILESHFPESMHGDILVFTKNILWGCKRSNFGPIFARQKPSK